MTRLLSDLPAIDGAALVETTSLGRHTKVAEYCRIRESEIGDYSYVMEHGHIWNAKIGKFSNIAAFARINATILPGLTIGNGSVVGAGAVVSKDVEPYTVVGGVAAKPIRERFPRDIAAIFFTDTGTLGKLYAEALENIDNKPRGGVASVGAPPVAVQRFGVLPQVLPLFASQALYFWESNTRSATIIGAVGAGGIGLKLWEAMRTNSDWENVAYMVVLILLVMYIFDTISNLLRSRLMGSASR